MTVISTPTAPLSALYIFPVQNSPAAGDPPFDPKKPLKNWKDPSALTAAPGTVTSDGVQYIVGGVLYPVLVLTPPANPSDPNSPYGVVASLAYFSREDAAAINLPTGTAAGKFQSAPIPSRPLEPGEDIQQLSPFSQPVIVNLALYVAQQQQEAEAEGKFTAQDRATLKAIAAKLGA